MLEAIRKRKNSPIVIFVLGLALLAMAAFGISTKGLGTSAVDAATVNGEAILDVDYSTVYARVFSQRQQQDRSYDRTKAEKDQLRERVLKELVTQKILAQQAKSRDLALDDEALRDAILAEKAFHVNGRFDKDLYQRFLAANQTTPERFEGAQREERLAGLLRDAVQNIGVTDEEVKDAFRMERERVVIHFVRVDKSSFESEVGTVTETDATEWAKSPDAEEQLKKYYAKHKSTKFDVPEQVCARHVLVRTTKQLPPDVQAQKRTTIEKALEAVNSGTPFETVAEKYSEDNNKDRGGDLGCFSAGQTVPRIEEEAFKLQPGQVSPIFESGFGLHILKVTERKEPLRKKLEDVRQEIALTLAAEARASALAKARAEAILAEAKAKGSLAKASEAATAKKQPAFVVETSQPFPRGRDFVAPLGMAEGVARLAWSLTKDSPLPAAPLETERGWVVIELKDRESPTEAEFESARPMLTWQLSQMKAGALVEGWSEALRKNAKVTINPDAISYDDARRSRMRQ